MCLYPKIILNRKYIPNKKNGGHPPPIIDERTKYVPIGCQQCIECRKQKAREWQTRLQEEIKTKKNGKFITLTFSNESIIELCETQEIKQLDGYERDNEIATVATRRFLERWRKTFKKSVKHWLITEIGHNGTENIHLHGIIWTDLKPEEIRKLWNYGWIWPRQNTWHGCYVNEATVNYISKYITKTDEKHKKYKSKILTSPGIGRDYTNREDSKKNKYSGTETNETYRTNTGHKIAMPIYWRNKIYSEKEREQLWLQKLDKQERWICGERVDISKGEEEYYKLLKWHRERNKQLGYGNGEKDWNREQYEKQRRELMIKKRIQNTKDKSTNKY